MSGKRFNMINYFFFLTCLSISIISCSSSTGSNNTSPNSNPDTLALSTSSSSSDYISDPVSLLIKFDATASATGVDPITGAMTYLLSADGFVPTVDEESVILEEVEDYSPIALLSNAQISFDFFDFSAPPAVVNFNCEGCTITFEDGSILESDPTVPLNGRVLFAYGPVNFDPATPFLQTVRMMGCAGLRETSGTGFLANKVGSICFNGVFDFDVSNHPQSLATVTGSSNCTLTLHTPVSPQL